MTAIATTLDELMVRSQQSLDPRNFSNEEFELFSIPAFDSGKPDQVVGGEVGSPKKIVKPGDVLLSRIVPHIRRAWVVPSANGKRQIASGEWIVFRHKAVEPRYLRHFVMGDEFHAKFMATIAGIGGSLVRARPENVGRIAISLPPLSEQRRIADILDKADGIRRKHRQAKTTLSSLASSLFHQRFGDPVENLKGWDVVPMETLFAISPNYGTMIVPSSTEQGWLDLRVANIQGGVLDLTNRKYVDLPDDMVARHEVRKGDLLLARAIGSLEHLGKCIIADPGNKRWAFDSHLMRVRFDTTKVEPQYIHAFLTSSGGRHEFLKNSRRSAVQYNINTKEMARIRVPLPPLSLQRTFVRDLNRIERLGQRQHTFATVVNGLFNAIAHQAFQGEP